MVFLQIYDRGERRNQKNQELVQGSRTSSSRLSRSKLGQAIARPTIHRRLQSAGRVHLPHKAVELGRKGPPRPRPTKPSGHAGLGSARPKWNHHQHAQTNAGVAVGCRCQPAATGERHLGANCVPIGDKPFLLGTTSDCEQIQADLAISHRRPAKKGRRLWPLWHSLDR